MKVSKKVEIYNGFKGFTESISLTAIIVEDYISVVAEIDSGFFAMVNVRRSDMEININHVILIDSFKKELTLQMTEFIHFCNEKF